MEQLGTIETVCRYPVKSMAGEDLTEAFVGYSGIMGDRVYAFVRPDGPKGFPWHTGREQENLLLFRPYFRETEAVTLPRDIEESLGMTPGVNPLFPADTAFAVDVVTPDGRVLPVRSAELTGELSQRGAQTVQLRFSERSLYDCRPISVFGNASARGLSEELGMAIDRRRFRANFYVEWADDRPYRENDLLGHTLQVGDRLRIMIVERDPRCKMITIDPDTSETEPRVLRHVTKAHGGMAGVYAAVLLEGVVHKGDPIFLV